MQDALVLKYGDEYLLWRDVFINGWSAEEANDKRIERNRDPNNKQASIKKGDLTVFEQLPDEDERLDKSSKSTKNDKKSTVEKNTEPKKDVKKTKAKETVDDKSVKNK